MTLVAILTTPDRAELVTDSLRCWTDAARPPFVAPGVKAHRLSGLPAMVASSGLVADGLRWTVHLDQLSQRVTSFDALVRAAEPTSCATEHAIFYAVGQRDDGAFAAYAWAPWTAWLPHDVSGWHLQPHPDGLAPGDDLMALQLEHEGRHRPEALEGLEPPNGPARPAPRSLHDWETVVRAIRNTRSVNPRDPRLFAPIGGVVTRHTLTVDDITSEEVTILDAPDELPSKELRRIAQLNWMMDGHESQHLQQLRLALDTNADCAALHDLAKRIDPKSAERTIANALLQSVGCSIRTGRRTPTPTPKDT